MAFRFFLDPSRGNSMPDQALSTVVGAETSARERAKSAILGPSQVPPEGQKRNPAAFAASGRYRVEYGGRVWRIEPVESWSGLAPLVSLGRTTPLDVFVAALLGPEQTVQFFGEGHSPEGFVAAAGSALGFQAIVGPPAPTS